MSGISYGAAGYLDTPRVSGYASVLVSVLSVATPALFFWALVGLRSLPLAYGRHMESIGFLVGCLGTALGVVDALVNAAGLEQTILGPTGIGLWWWAMLLAALTLMGLATLSNEGWRHLGVAILASNVLGWVSLLADPAFSGVLVPLRAVHVAFAAVFCIGVISWGGMLFCKA